MIAVVLLLLLSFSLVQGARTDKKPKCKLTFNIPASPCKEFCVTRRFAYFIPIGKIVNKTDNTPCKRFLSRIEGHCEKGKCVMGGVLGFLIKFTPFRRFG
ncbi:hypothetical protein V5799_016500 [Amblyomma americanum]|uniref:Secreted protein n=1 Tax=Amblyomma americanum TaxID=6943 RepID=A0AAQ4F675_AMBAM